jgi:hypothetical protein
MVNTMVKAFDENQEILIPTAQERKFILRFDIRRHEDASRRYRGRNFILMDPEQLVSAHWTRILPQDPATGGIQEDAQGNQKMEFHSDTKIDIVPLMDGVEVHRNYKTLHSSSSCNKHLKLTFHHFS